MAWSTVETHIANPAGKGKHMAKKMTAKQIKYFGSKRQRAALKAKRRNTAKSSAKKHRARSKPNPARHKKHRRATAAPRTKKRASARKNSASHRKPKRRNPVPQIIAWTAGNPAKRRTHVKRRKKRASARRSNAGTRHYKRRNKAVHHHRRRRGNPGALGTPIDWVTGGAGVVAGGLGSRLIPQLVLGASNTGAMGYAANAVTALALGWVSHMMFKGNKVLTVAVIAGGFGSLIQRVITEQTPYGAALSQPSSGLGDWGLGLYQKSNYLTPQRIQGPHGPSSSNFYWGDGSQATVPSFANQGMDGPGTNC